MPNNQDAKPDAFLPVDDGVGEVGQRVDSPTIGRRRANAWMLLNQLRDAFELIEESPGKSDSRFALVEPNCLCEVFRGGPVYEPIH